MGFTHSPHTHDTLVLFDFMMHSRIQIIFYQRTISYCSEGVDKIISTAHNIIRSENNLENVQFYLFVNNYMHACMLAERERERKKEMMIGRAIELATYPVTTDRRLCQMNRFRR